jgi:hypothetical protein
MLCFFIRYFQQSCVKKTVLAFSILTFLIGAALIGLSFLVIGNAFMQISTDDFTLPQAMFICLIVFGVLAVCTGVIGIVLSMKVGPKMIAFFAILSFFVSMAFIGIGAALLVFNAQAKQYLDDYCDGEDVDQTNPLAEIVGDADAITELINEYMCTSTCPCPASASQYYTNLEGRQWGGDVIYENFEDCYKNLLKTQEGNIKDIDSSILDMYSEIEADNDCAGLCTAPSFYYSRDVVNGMPEKSCKSSI